MSKQCAKCEKTVYPIEEFRCLDKVVIKTELLSLSRLVRSLDYSI